MTLKDFSELRKNLEQIIEKDYGVKVKILDIAIDTKILHNIQYLKLSLESVIIPEGLELDNGR